MSKEKDRTQDAAEFGLLRAYLAQNGVSQAQITEVIGTGAAGRTRSEITDLLRDWFKVLPKAN